MTSILVFLTCLAFGQPTKNCKIEDICSQNKIKAIVLTSHSGLENMYNYSNDNYFQTIAFNKQEVKTTTWQNLNVINFNQRQPRGIAIVAPKSINFKKPRYWLSYIISSAVSRLPISLQKSLALTPTKNDRTNKILIVVFIIYGLLNILAGLFLIWFLYSALIAISEALFTFPGFI